MGCPICQDIDEQVQAFLNRPLQESGYAYVYLDTTYLHGRLGKALQVCSRARADSKCATSAPARPASMR